MADSFSVHKRCADYLVSCKEPDSVLKALLDRSTVGWITSGSHWFELCRFCGKAMGDGDTVYVRFNVRDGNSHLEREEGLDKRVG